MKQHPDNVNRDLDDEVAEAIEHQYARRLIKGAVGNGGATGQAADTAARKRSPDDKSRDDDFNRKIEQLREKSGF